ncbi:tRNA (adenine(22)-N(1))-methyltransferase [Microaceticoccus formicicus]|uniref:tRNA (adenine(22)-N(1))-methyltransferase n=1 Tax=Microaceticoccus formicicus TaxID=3118105 RepID=UPI003CD035A5|nr:class I SAM-dependent methyltransferase [Peptoniphilaceae bacterium AMB_02]
MIELNASKRIKEILQMIPSCKIVADIGTDHGILPILLAESGRCEEIIATDISRESLDKLVKKLEENPEINNISTIVSDGLSKITEPYPDVVVISGMGSRLIIKILEEASDKAKQIKTFIFQPNTTVDELRVYLHDNGYKIINEALVYENNRFYNILATERNNELYNSKSHYKYGKLLLENRNENLRKHLLDEKNRFEKLFKELQTMKNKSQVRIDEIVEELEIIAEALNYYEII